MFAALLCRSWLWMCKCAYFFFFFPTSVTATAVFFYCAVNAVMQHRRRINVYRKSENSDKGREWRCLNRVEIKKKKKAMLKKEICLKTLFKMVRRLHTVSPCFRGRQCHSFTFTAVATAAPKFWASRVLVSIVKRKQKTFVASVKEWELNIIGGSGFRCPPRRRWTPHRWRFTLRLPRMSWSAAAYTGVR